MLTSPGLATGWARLSSRLVCVHVSGAVGASYSQGCALSAGLQAQIGVSQHHQSNWKAHYALGEAAAAF